MRKKILYKEWIKTRWVLGIVVLSAILLHWYVFSKIGRALTSVGAEHIWDVIVNRNVFMFSEFLYFPILSAIIFSLFQFIPEMLQKRLKLTLHLPLKERTIILWILGYGVISLFAIFLVQWIAFIYSMHIHFPNEILISSLITLAPAYLSGFVVYFMVVAIAVEPSWKMRIVLSLIGIGMVRVFFLSNFPESYRYLLPYLPLVAFIAILFSVLSIFRFKTGVQN